MVTITQDTIENTLPLFLRSLLTNNLTDPRSSRSYPFVFKEPPEHETEEFPYVVITQTDSETEYPSMDANLRIDNDYSYMITVLSKGENAIYIRDSLTDEIKTILSDTSKEDEDGVSMKEAGVLVKRITSSPNDIYTSDGNVLRIKDLVVTVRYIFG